MVLGCNTILKQSSNYLETSSLPTSKFDDFQLTKANSYPIQRHLLTSYKFFILPNITNPALLIKLKTIRMTNLEVAKKQ